MLKGSKHSEATRLRMISSQKRRVADPAYIHPMMGRKHSQDTMRKMRSATRKTRILSVEHKRRISAALIGHSVSEESKAKISKSGLGRVVSLETRRAIAESSRGSKSHCWMGGKTEANGIIRGSFEYKLWRESVFKRDNFTCVWCGDDRGGNLNADHIKPFSLFSDLRLDIDNGRTLCEPCHRTTNTYGRPTGELKKQYANV